MSVLLEVENLRVTDERNQEEIIHDVSFSLEENSCLGIVGESGSGKSMIAKALLGLNHPWLKSQGEASFSTKGQGLNLLNQDKNKMRAIRGKHICMILQDAMSAFDPLGKIGEQMAETFVENKNLSKKQGLKLAQDALKVMNMHEPDQVIKKYPHQLSGGMLQRCMIATALAMEPDIIVADEPTTALDSINQGQVVEEFKIIRKAFGTALIFISHDLGVVKHLSDDLLVMKDGCAVEYGNAETIFKNPQHIYTKYLIDTRLELTESFRKAMKKGAANG
ncbi:ABC transporter ATP-binding protein [Acetobacterium bakii]|uniref:Peptide ABC transporter ATP-binding protein n=1 Tax=Acetobacterium bakii TaxID=52689 RepID=A0A0L6TY11_9FIRM|nr:ABC transporter ATP-binding protein [Acetobacterium bakii]KNZ41138.1 peptide ABC transporter ATP-binding protein [Acetobacterium bakii]